VESNHYCTHLNEGTVFPSSLLNPTTDTPSLDVRQCLIYDTGDKNARLIGVEYMISAALYKTLEPSERKLWHSHVFEVKSGMLIMPGPDSLPTSVWEEAETKEMEDVVGLYGKTYHFWQVDRGDKLPLGEPQLMMSLIDSNQQPPGFDEVLDNRDKKYRIDRTQKAEKRKYIPEPTIDGGGLYPLNLVLTMELTRSGIDADSMWHSSKGSRPTEVEE